MTPERAWEIRHGHGAPAILDEQVEAWRQEWERWQTLLARRQVKSTMDWRLFFAARDTYADFLGQLARAA